jgi:hypothetical protein
MCQIEASRLVDAVLRAKAAALWEFSQRAVLLSDYKAYWAGTDSMRQFDPLAIVFSVANITLLSSNTPLAILRIEITKYSLDARRTRILY